MANYNIVIDTSNFRPYDINPAITILNGYAEQRRRDQEVYDKIAQQLGELATAVGGTEKAKAIWEAYNGDLQAAMADFAQGSNQATGRALSAMRQRYFKDVVPLEKAREAMLKNLELLRNRSSQDGTLLSEKLGNLDTYLENPTYTPRMYSGALLRTQVEGMMQSIADDIITTGRLKNLDPYTQQILKKTGYDMNTIRAAMADYMQTGRIDNPVMQSVMDSVWASAGFDKWDMDDATRNNARGWMAQGLMKGSGKKDIAFQEDKAAKAALDWTYKQLELEKTDRLQRERMILQNTLDQQLEMTKLQAKAALEGGDPYSQLQTSDVYEGPVDPKIEKFNGLVGKLYTESGGLSRAYFGKSKEGWNITNPMKVREEYDKKRAAGYDDKTARRLIKRDFSDQNLEIISKEEYNQLKEIGIGSKTGVREMQRKVLTHINGLKQRYRPTSMHFTDYGLVNADLERNLDMDTKIWETDPSLKEGKPVPLKKLFGTKGGNTEAEVIDVAYSIQNPKKVLVATKDKSGDIHRYYVPASLFSVELYNLLDRYAQNLRGETDPETLSEAQKYIAVQMMQLLRSQNPVPSKTISTDKIN